MNPKPDPAKWDAEWDKLLAEEAETMDKMETMSINDIVEDESDGKLAVSRAGANAVKIKGDNVEITDNNDPIFENFKEQLG